MSRDLFVLLLVMTDEYFRAPEILSHLTPYLSQFVLGYCVEWSVALLIHFSPSFLSTTGLI
jgi:hypothetical protein